MTKEEKKQYIVDALSFYWSKQNNELTEEYCRKLDKETEKKIIQGTEKYVEVLEWLTKF
jgi:hypothetical protein